ncbi:ral GTPase-activating protein subunit beta isoform X2 [Pieris brassicae]|uniref:ral GTPase-activating protein subunit beta isoform X2 n=1 Tax=Pieris brassicae TaxID=7116 RepID=UPI001E65EF4D|nr:ral GTPase-activating protein subunit beta isoform X2 [Pieris brassicae]
MNVGIFNRVNSKNRESDGMYSEWSSLPLEGGGCGVLGAVGGRDVVLAVVRQLASHQPSPLNTDAEVEWVLEVIRYGLSLPLSEHEAVRDCVRVCCSWLSALLPPAAPAQPPPPAVPAPLAASPERYATKILSHLHNLFVPRHNETLTFIYQTDLSADLISKQAVLCHRVLRLARSLADSASLGSREWRALLLLLLAAASALLAPPAPVHGAAEQLCERVLCVLFEVWILACHRCFPSPPLWRTLREHCISWRHRAPLTEQWTRVSLCLTARLLKHMYGPLFPVMPISDEDATLVPADMSAESVMQSWYRILHTIGNPVDLCHPHLIAHTPHLLQYSMRWEEGSNQQAWLAALPAIFHRAMLGLAAHVDAFLGRGQERWWAGGAGVAGVADEQEEELTPPTHRRLAKSFSTSRPREKMPEKSTPRSSLIALTGSRPSSVIPTTPPNSISSQVGETEKPPLTPLRPKVNSILHLFGEWLFEAALIGTNPANTQQRSEGTPPPSSFSDSSQKLNLFSYQAGRAVALGTLCRVICSKQCREEVLAPYLARTYAALQRGLRDPATAAAVVLDAADIFRLDLDGVLVLVPDFISALDRILSEREPKLECGSIDKRELRKAAISLLLSLVAFPYHYKGLPVPEFPGCNEYAGMTLGEYARAKLSLICVSAVQVETSDSLAVPLLSALYLCVRHNTHSPNKAHSAPPGSALSHSTEYKARSEGGSGPASAESVQDDFAADVRELDPSSPVFGAALVIRATYLVCHRLISSWKGDLQVSLAALELLSGLAKLHSAKPDALERKRAVRWICDYISVQCGRPPQAHSRDLHSCVVAAYTCLASWLCPALLNDPDCLAALMEVVELGISGSKSQGKPGEPTKMKDEKELKPVSMRVRDAAEALLMLILEQSGSNGTGTWCRLDERWLSALGHGKLRHFVADGSTLLSLLEEPLANSQEPQPTIVVIIRTGWGRYAWSLSSRGAARSAGRGAGGACPRPVAILEPPARPPPHCRPLCAPPPCALDSAFPSLDSVLRQLNDPEATVLFKLLEQQASIERRVRESEDNVTGEEYVPPEPVTEFQTARMFLSHFGYLNIAPDKKNSLPRLQALDSSASDFSAALRRLDGTGSRAALTVHVLCVRAGQRRASDIVANSLSAETVPAGFIRMLRGLGTPVRVSGHAGWTGHVRTSYDAQPHFTHTEQTPPDKIAPALYDGREQVLYWSDSTDEIAFVVPSGNELNDAEEETKTDVDGSCLSVNRNSDKGHGSCWDVSSGSHVSYERSTSECERTRTRAPLSDKTRALSLELDRALTGSGRRNRDFTPKILIIWLEDFEDHLNLPIDDLLRYCETGVPWRRHEVWCVCVSAVLGGLVRLLCPPAAGVLADGALVAPRLLPDCLRRAATHLARRTRLNTDLYQPPHVRRRHLIQEIAQQYKKDLDEPQLLESLFKAP